jgi:hypothetical protein
VTKARRPAIYTNAIASPVDCVRLPIAGVAVVDLPDGEQLISWDGSDRRLGPVAVVIERRGRHATVVAEAAGGPDVFNLLRFYRVIK